MGPTERPTYRMSEARGRFKRCSAPKIKILILIFRCEGTADYMYSDKIRPEYSYGAVESSDEVLERLPKEQPFPIPEVGKW